MKYKIKKLIEIILFGAFGAVLGWLVGFFIIGSNVCNLLGKTSIPILSSVEPDAHCDRKE